jgi:CrcB protein
MLTMFVALAAGVGALARYAADRLITARSPSDFPYGTFAVNVTGSLLLGFLVGIAPHSGAATVAGAGFAGGFTTLSTWAWESVALAEKGSPATAVANVFVSLATGLAAAAAGLGFALL